MPDQYDLFRLDLVKQRAYARRVIPYRQWEGRMRRFAKSVQIDQNDSEFGGKSVG
jgi:hypothetical protein